MSGHSENEDIIKRLKRANGHLMKVIEMLESDSECMKVAQQLQAVSSAIITAKKTYIHDHVEHCLAEAKDQKAFNSKIKEFKEITKYL
ncbi:MAG: metal-sensing transcriptional repressor [Bdellovibrionales bacterium]|nr:metal-sensing transcriptional repressor [Bdellovibrionales bacterium]